MRKVINLEDLDCPVCAQKIEDKLKKMPEINEVSVSFITQKIIRIAIIKRYQIRILCCSAFYL